jgi:hypothetical protein
MFKNQIFKDKAPTISSHHSIIRQNQVQENHSLALTQRPIQKQTLKQLEDLATNILLPPVPSTPELAFQTNQQIETPVTPVSTPTTPKSTALSIPMCLNQSKSDQHDSQKQEIEISDQPCDAISHLTRSSKWETNWLQINNNVLPFIKVNQSTNISFSLSKSYKECSIYVSIRHLNQIGLYATEFGQKTLRDLDSRFKSYVRADMELSNELRTMAFKLNLLSRYVKLDDNQYEICHLVNLQEFHMAFLKKKLYFKVLGNNFLARPDKLFVKNYQKVLNQSGGLAVIKRPDNGRTITCAFVRMPSGRLLTSDDVINVLGEQFPKVSVEINLQTIEDEVVLDKIGNFFQLMFFYINEDVQLRGKMNPTFINLEPYLKEFRENIRLICRYDDTFSETWLNDYDKFIASIRPLVNDVSNSTELIHHLNVQTKGN